MTKWKSLEQHYRDQRANQHIENMIWEAQLDEIIVNSNSSGQGYDAEHMDHEHHDTIQKHGYRYSHSTPVRKLDGSTVNHHTYKHVNNQDKNVTVYKTPNPRYKGGESWHQWHTSTSGLGHPGVTGLGKEALDKHLKTRKIKKLVTHNDLKEEVAIEPVDEISMAVNKLDKKEEVEIEEISKETLQSYVKKAKIDRDHGGKKMRQGYRSGADTYHKRKYGISDANEKLGKSYRPAHLPFHTVPVKKEEIETPVVEPIEELAPDPVKAKMDAQRQQVQKQRDQLKLQLQKQKADKQMQADKAKGQDELQKIKEDEIELDEMETVKNKGDHDVLRAFANKQTHQSKKLSTDGTTLHGNWMGGHSIAHWDGDKVRFRTASSRSEQAVHRALRKKHLADADIHLKEDEINERMVRRVRTYGRSTKLQQLHARQYQRLAARGDLAGAEAHRKRAAEYKRIAYQATDNPGKLPSV